MTRLKPASAVHEVRRHVAINFCGGCNPVIGRRDIALKIKDALSALGFAVSFNDWEADFIVRLSGCPADCASRHHPPGRPGAAIAGRTFAAVAAEEDELADLAIAATIAYFDRAPMIVDALRSERLA